MSIATSPAAGTQRPALLAPQRLHHAAWVTPDAARLVDFYTRVLGMELVHSVMDDRVPSTGQAFPYLHIFFRMQDGSTIAFFEAPSIPPRPASAHPAYEVFDHFAMHAASRTDQFPMYVVGQADGFSLDESGQPFLTPVAGGGHFHNAPGTPHAFVPKVGKAVNADWEIVFIAITPRNLKEDTQKVSEATRAAYKQAVGSEAPVGI